METFTRALVLAAVAGLVAPPPLPAESFSVTLVNGAVIESRYPPRQAPEDPQKLQLATEWGNWISLDREDVRAIHMTAAKAGGDGALDIRPRFVGTAPNDAPRAGRGSPDTSTPLDPEALLDYLLRRRLAQLEERLRQVRANTVAQFSEPPVAGRDRGAGLPLWRGTATTMDPELLRIQGLTPELVLRLQGLTEAAAVPLEGLAAAPPAAFLPPSSPPGD